MKLTAGQKNALSRKAFELVEKRRIEFKKKVLSEWKPDKNVVKFLEKVKKWSEMRKAYYSMARELGFDKQWSQLYHEATETVPYKIQISFQEDGNSDIYQMVYDQIADHYATDMADKEIPMITDYDIMDELELVSLSKDFDVDAFLKKYSGE